LVSACLFSQKPDDAINFGDFDAVFFESLLEERVNNFRKENNKHLLETDEYLHLAASDQAKYIFKSKKLTPTQPIKKKAKPIDRVVFYDGMHSKVAESSARVFAGKKVKISGSKRSIVLKSYAHIVDYVFSSWKKAKGGTERMLNDGFYRFSTASEVDEKEKVIVVTQVYGSTPFELPEGVKFQKDDYKLTPYSRDKCAYLDKKYAYLPELLSDNIYFKDNQIYFYFHDLALFKDVLKESDDAIALDIVARNQFDCGKGNTYFPSKLHKGILLEPINKSQLFSNVFLFKRF